MVQGRRIGFKIDKKPTSPLISAVSRTSLLSLSFSTAAFSRQNLHHREPPLASPWSASTATTREQRRRTKKQREGAEKIESNREEEKNKNRQQPPFSTTATPPRAATSTAMSRQHRQVSFLLLLHLHCLHYSASEQWRASPLFTGSTMSDPDQNCWAGSDLVQKSSFKILWFSYFCFLSISLNIDLYFYTVKIQVRY